MKKSLTLAVAALGLVASMAWAGPGPSAPSVPPLQCACAAGGPVA